MTNSQFLQLNKSVDTLKTSVDTINKSLKVINKSIEVINKTLVKLSDRIDNLDVKVTKEIKRLDTRITSLDITFHEFAGFVAARFDKVEERLDRLENNQDYFIKQINNLNEEKIIADYRQRTMEKWALEAGNKINLPYQI